MKKICALAIVLLGFVSVGMASAADKIAVIDVQAAILNSEEAKLMVADMRKEYEPDQKELKELVDGIKKLRAKLEQDGAVMSDAEKKNLSKDMEGKAVDHQFKVKKLQKAVNESQQELLVALGPKFKAAVDAIITEGKYGLILRSEVAIHATSDYDITKQITERMNANR